MTKILVGFGTHDHSNRALEWAAMLAARTGAAITVLNVFHPTYAEMSPDVHAELVAERRQQISRIMQESGHDDFEIEVRSGEALNELVRSVGHRPLISSSLVVTNRWGRADSVRVALLRYYSARVTSRSLSSTTDPHCQPALVR